MCGRYILYSGDKNRKAKQIIVSVEKKYHIEMKKGDIYPSDIAPVFICDSQSERMTLELMSWGYQKHFNNKTLLINARSETILEKKMFSADFIKRRCLIPAVGFYEWNTDKEKFLFTGENELLYFGGIYHQQAEGNYHFLIITKPASDLVASVHNRMPVIISEKQNNNWFNAPETAQKLMAESNILLVKNTISLEKQISLNDLSDV